MLHGQTMVRIVCSWGQAFGAVTCAVSLLAGLGFLCANSSHLHFPAPMTQELELTLSLIPYSSISRLVNMAIHADSMDEVRGDGRKHIGR